MKSRIDSFYAKTIIKILTLALCSVLGCSHISERDNRSPFTSESGNPESENSFEGFRREGDAAYKNKDFPRALQCYQQADRLKPNAPLKVQIGDCLIELEKN